MESPPDADSPKPNWELLPQEFHYLIDATKFLSVYCGEQAGDFYPTDEEIELMERTAEKVRANGGFELILDWVIEHRDFHIVGQVLFLMERAGFQLS